MLGLVLTAGGARGAYQAGVLKRIGEMPSLRGQPCPFPIVTGASAGAINGSCVAGMASDFRRGTERLANLWSGLQVADVFRTDWQALGSTAAKLVFDMTLGGLVGGGLTSALFDASPLRAYLARALPLGGVATAIRDGHLYALAIAATSYHSGRSFTFIQGRPGHPMWRRRRRVTIAETITSEHVCASAAIPIVFAPVPLQIEGHPVFFGDGGLRLVTPFSPAIRLGADRVLAIGIRSNRAADDLARSESPAATEAFPLGAVHRPPLAQVCGVFLNAVFLDHLDADYDHLIRMNELIQAHGGAVTVGDAPGLEPMRPVTPFVISPSEDLAVVAQSLADRMPRVVRYLMDGLGTPDAQSADLMSYLLFDSAYTRALIDIGHADAGKRIDEIESFLFSDAPAATSAA